jgi:hypothetical protein
MGLNQAWAAPQPKNGEGEHVTSGMDPLLSVVVTSRNDNHGGSLLRRMQTFVNAFIAQCRRHSVSAELIIVEWNPPPDRPRLDVALEWPALMEPCQVRIIEVPAELHGRLAGSESLPLFQMIAKNVGIRRARGAYILATNIDIIFSDEIMKFISSRCLKPGRLYRVDRLDIMPDVPVSGRVEEQLTYCQRHLIRRNAAEGSIRLKPDGTPHIVAGDVFTPDSGILPERGFFDQDPTAAVPRRWAGPEARLRLTPPPEGNVLSMTVAPGPGVQGKPFDLQIRDEAGNLVSQLRVTGRDRLLVSIPRATGTTGIFSLRTPQGGHRRENYPNVLNFALFQCGWLEASDLRTPATDAAGAALTDQTVDRGIELGRGFEAPSACEGRYSRRVAAEARLALTGAGRVLSLELEMAPELGPPGVHVDVVGPGATVLARFYVTRRQRFFVTLPANRRTPCELVLCARRNTECGGGGPVPWLYRLHSCSRMFVDLNVSPPQSSNEHPVNISSPPPPEEAPVYWDMRNPGHLIHFLRDWDSQETHAGEVFRWARDGATLRIARDPQHSDALLYFLLEPAVAPLDLEIRDSSGNVLVRKVVAERSVVEIPSTNQEPQELSFHTAGNRLQTESDPRCLRIRIIRPWPEARMSLPDRLRNLQMRALVGIRKVSRHITSELSRVTTATAQVLPARPAASRPSTEDEEPAATGKPASSVEFPPLHTNACGDFTLLHRQDWYALHGYSELEVYSLHLDSLFCFNAQVAGMIEVVLADPYRIYHIEHSVGSGWTPEGQNLLLQQLEKRKIQPLTSDQLFSWVAEMRRLRRPMHIAPDTWGMADERLREVVIVSNVKAAAQ